MRKISGVSSKKDKSNLKESPLKIYDNLLFISSQNGTEPPIECDFAMAGDQGQLASAIVIQMNRHPELAKLLKTAVTVFENSEVTESKKPSVLNAGLPSRFR